MNDERYSGKVGIIHKTCKKEADSQSTQGERMQGETVNMQTANTQNVDKGAKAPVSKQKPLKRGN